MSELRRFYKDMDGEMCPVEKDTDPYGEWVRYEDALELQRSLTREENARLILANENLRLIDVIRTTRGCSSGNCEE
jgi:hypothetical protein